MKNKAKWFILGMVFTLVLTSTVSVFSDSIEKQITAVFDSIKIVVDGIPISPTDSQGNQVEPFIYNGTTYLPVRAISNAFGKNVSWDENSKTVYIGENIPQSEITVDNAEDLIKNIGSNKKIILKSGVYDLTNVNKMNSPEGDYFWEDVYDGQKLVITNVSNLTIEGPTEGVAEITTTPRYAEVISFQNSSNIAIKNIKAGHKPMPYECDAGVLGFENCNYIILDNNYLYGCGSMGVSCLQSKRLNINNCTITDCSLEGIDICSSSDITVLNTKFTANRASNDIFNINTSTNVLFENCVIEENNKIEMGLAKSYASYVVFNQCTFANNSTPDQIPNTVSMFNTSEGTTTVRNCIIKNNKFSYLTTNDYTSFDNCTIEENSFPAK